MPIIYMVGPFQTYCRVVNVKVNEDSFGIISGIQKYGQTGYILDCDSQYPECPRS